MGSAPEEIGTVLVPIPDTLTSEIEIVLQVDANSETADSAVITNLAVIGSSMAVNTPETAFELRERVSICHFDDKTDTFKQITVPVVTLLDGRGHGHHGDDIIPAFWYIDKSGQIIRHAGTDWNKTGLAIFKNNCGEIG